MTYELTDEEKSKVVETRLKSLEYSIYNVNLSKREENAKSTPDQGAIADYNIQLADFNARKSLLESELALLEE
jgi:hypothetical protein